MLMELRVTCGPYTSIISVDNYEFIRDSYGVPCCPICKQAVIDGIIMYLINSPGGYGWPGMWACNECLENAKPGSKLQELRDGIYAKDFAAC